MSIAVFNKDPEARKDYTIDWTDFLGTDTIAASAWTLDTGITNYSNVGSTDKKSVIWLTGGTAGTDYTVTNQITTTNGLIEQRSLKIQVREQ